MENFLSNTVTVTFSRTNVWLKVKQTLKEICGGIVDFWNRFENRDGQMNYFSGELSLTIIPVLNGEM
jgi:hypothetical protein